jgi:hypothetical protein
LRKWPLGTKNTSTASSGSTNPKSTSSSRLQATHAVSTWPTKWNDWKYGIDIFRGKDSTTPTVTTRYPWASTNMSVRGGWAKFSFRVVRNGKMLVSRWQDINAFTGNLGKGDMGLSLDDQKITIVDGFIIRYTF